MGAFYKSFMDEARVEQLGAKAIAPELSDVRSAKTREDLASLAGRNTTDFEGTLFDLYIDADLKDPNRYAVYVSQAGLGLPDRDYYLKPEFAAQKKKYQEYTAAMLQFLDWPDAAERAKDVVEFESRLADASWSKAQQRDLVATYNPMTVAELGKLAPGFAWTGFFRGCGTAENGTHSCGGKERLPEAGVDLGADAGGNFAGMARRAHCRQCRAVPFEGVRGRLFRYAR